VTSSGAGHSQRSLPRILSPAWSLNLARPSLSSGSKDRGLVDELPEGAFFWSRPPIIGRVSRPTSEWGW
jgi:hypothetical protein